MGALLKTPMCTTVCAWLAAEAMPAGMPGFNMAFMQSRLMTQACVWEAGVRAGLVMLEQANK